VERVNAENRAMAVQVVIGRWESAQRGPGARAHWMHGENQ
jgi:hypothetical protein